MLENIFSSSNFSIESYKKKYIEYTDVYLVEISYRKGAFLIFVNESEEDDYNVQCLAAKVTSDIQNGNVGRNQELIDWLKSLKQRIEE